VIGVKAGPVQGLDDLQPLLVIFAERQIVAVEMVENAELQIHIVPPADALVLFVNPPESFGSAGALAVKTTPSWWVCITRRSPGPKRPLATDVRDSLG
jgi:hypothetical protein